MFYNISLCFAIFSYILLCFAMFCYILLYFAIFYYVLLYFTILKIFIRQQTIDPDEFMVSFDVESLYTNIPITDALLVIKELLNNDTTLQD